MSRLALSRAEKRATRPATFRRGRPSLVQFAAAATAITMAVSGLAAPEAWADPDPSISGRVWSNLNGNATQESYEPDLAGIGVQLVGAGVDGTLDTPDDVSFTEQTADSSGGYGFPNLTAGRYRLQLNSASLPATKIVTAGTTPLVIDLGAAEQRAANFGLSDNGSISGKVWSDSNANGTADPGEPGTPSANVNLLGAGSDATFGTSDDVVFAAVSTSSNGDYTFTNLSPDSYRVSAGSFPAGRILTGNTQNPTPVALALSQVAENVNFGHAQLSWVTLPMAPAEVSTFAGSGTNAGVDGSGSGASFKGLQGVAVSGGFAYVGSYGSIRKVSLASGAVTTLAGSTPGSTTGCANSTTPGSVTFPSVFAVATDGTYVYSTGCGIRRTSIATGATSTVSSSGSYVTVGPDGFLYVSSGSSVLKIDPVNGTSSTFASLPLQGDATVSGHAITSDATSLWVLTQTASSGSYPTYQRHIIKVSLADGSTTVLLDGGRAGGISGAIGDIGLGGIASAGDYLYISGGVNCTNTCATSPSQLRRVAKANGAVVNVAGATTAGYADGTGTDAWFSSINGLASDGTSLWIADNGNYRLRRAVAGQPLPSTQPPGQTSTLAIAPAMVSTVAGNGASATADGLGTAASFRSLAGVTAAGGFAYVASYGSIRKVDLATGAVSILAGNTGSTTGCVNSTSPGSVTFPSSFDVATDGTYVYSTGCGIRRTSIATGATSTVSSPGSYVTVGPDGFLYASSGSSVLKIDPVNGTSSTFAVLPLQGDATVSGHAITSDATSLWVLTQTASSGSYPTYQRHIIRVSLADGSTTVLLDGGRAGGISGAVGDIGLGGIASAGDYLYISGGMNCTNTCTTSPSQLRRVAKANGAVINVAGATTAGYADATGTDAWFSSISGLASDGTSLWIADNGNYRLRRAVAGQPLPSTQPSGQTSTLAVNPANTSTFAGSGVSAGADGSGLGASFRSLSGVALSSGFAYVGSYGSIRKVSLASGAVTTLAGSTSGSSTGCANSLVPGSVTFPGSFDVATDGTYVYSTGCGIRRTSIATGATSTVSSPGSYVTVGPDGFLYASSGSSVLKIDPVNGTSSTFATLPLQGDATVSGHAITSDATSLWVLTQTATSGSYPTYQRHVIKVSLADGSTTAVLDGGRAGYISGVIGDIGLGGIASAGDYLYISGGMNCTNTCTTSPSQVRRVAKANGAVVNVAGTTTAGHADGTGTDAWFSSINGLASDGTSLWIADNGNYRLRRAVAGQPLPSTQPSGQTSTLGVNPANASTFAGSGTSTTVNGTGTTASFRSLAGVTVAGGFAYVGSYGSIRKVNAATGAVSILAGNTGTTGCANSLVSGSVTFPGSFDVATDGTYVYSTGCGIRRTSIATGATSTVSASASGSYVTVGPNGFLYVSSGSSVLKIDPVNGTSSTFATLPLQGDVSVSGYAITSDATSLWVLTQTATSGSYPTYQRHIIKVSLADGSTTVLLDGGRAGYISGVIGDIGLGGIASAGDYLYISGGMNCTNTCTTSPSQLRRVAKATGAVLSVAGTTTAGYADGTGTDAWFSSITGLASDGTSLWIADNGNYRLRRAGQGKAPTAQGGPSRAYETLGGSNPSEKYCGACHGDPIDSATGNFFESETDVAVPGRGVPLAFTRTYSSLSAAHSSTVGYGWTHNYAMAVVADPYAANTMNVVQENASEVSFTADGQGGYTAPTRVQASLVKHQDGTYTFTRRNREIFLFNATGRLTALKDLNGYTTTLAYNGSGQLTTVTDPAGRTLTFTYTSGRIATITDPASRVVSFGYDSSANLTSVTDLGAGITRFGYDANHLILTRTDPRNNVVMTNTYDSARRVLTQKDALNRTSTWAYGPSSTTYTDPKGNVTVEQFSDGMLVSETKAVGTAQEATSTYAYDPVSLGVTSTTDPNSHTTTATYDARGNLLTQTDALNRTTTYTYNALNDVTSVTDAKGVTTAMTYDTAGTPLTTSTPLTGTSQIRMTALTYGDPAKPADVTSTTDPDGKVTSFTYDSWGNLTWVTDPLGNTTKIGYDVVGRKTWQVAPKGNVTGADPDDYKTTFAFNAFGEVTGVTDPLGHVTSRTYDANGNVTSETDANNHTTSFTYDAANQRTQTTRADLTTLVDGYDLNGNLTSHSDGANNTTSYGYDALDRVTSSTDPLNRTTSYAFDVAGNRTSLLDAASETTNFGFDNANQLTSITYVGGGAPNVSFAYDQNGQRTSMVDGTGTTTYAYDSLGRLTSSTDGAGKTVGYGYDLRSNITSIIYPGTTGTVTRGYDDAGRMTTVTDWLSNQTSFGYDSGSNLVSQVYPNGTTATSTVDAADRLMAMSHAPTENPGSPFAAFDYGRDSAGRLTSVTSAGVPADTHAYGYTPIDKLQAVDAVTNWAYDTADNLVQSTGGKNQAYDVGNQICWTASATGSSCVSPPTGATTYTHDVRGNRSGVTAAGVTTTLTYDQANRLITYGTAATYGYNGDGLRMNKTVSGPTAQFTWDVARGLPLLLTDGTTNYLHGPGGLPLAQIAASGTVTYHHHDQLGSTRALTSAAGSVVATYTYDPYGKLTASTGSATNPYGYAGQYTDPESGLQYLRARYFDPDTATFLTRDPVEALTMSAYAYASGNPLNVTDPSGLFGFQALTAAAGALTGAVVNSVSYAISCSGSQDCGVRGAAGAFFGGAVGGAIAGGCMGTTFQVVGCGAAGGEISYLLGSAIAGTTPTFAGAVASGTLGAIGNGISSLAGRGIHPYFGRPLPGNALSNASGAIGSALTNLDLAGPSACVPVGSRGTQGSIDGAGVPIPSNMVRGTR